MSVMVVTPLYSGPAEVLLKLIATQELDIWEISLKELVDGYISELEQREVVDLEEATELLMIASILMEIKSRGLFPQETEDLIEELPDGVFDLLIARMMECKTYKAVSQVFVEMSLKAARSVPRQYGLDSRFLELLPDLLENVEARDIGAAYLRATTPKSAPVFNLNHISPITRTVPETVDLVIASMLQNNSTTFKELTSTEDRIGIVFCFLAVLELYKNGMLDIVQAQTFGEIRLEWKGD